MNYEIFIHIILNFREISVSHILQLTRTYTHLHSPTHTHTHAPTQTQTYTHPPTHSHTHTQTHQQHCTSLRGNIFSV